MRDERELTDYVRALSDGQIETLEKVIADERERRERIVLRALQVRFA